MLNSQPCQQQMEARKKHIRSLFLSRAPLTAPHQGGTEQGFLASPAIQEIERKYSACKSDEKQSNLMK